ncbi:SNF2 family domain-containing protein [Colletotrichum limetticola]|uniref:SNF2 family domain-containing protein n=1 Tax=Colletotrichum limetticola TaxID=1209924 RepID=A0ABQ9PMJ1_9PEZI|nr:SNF2 family domain-containing protein [Colletotrichum limetticola]
MDPSEENDWGIAESDREASQSSHTTLGRDVDFAASDQHDGDLFVKQEGYTDRFVLDAPGSDCESGYESLSDSEYSDDGSESEMREEGHQVTPKPTTNLKPQKRKRAPRRKNARDYVERVVNDKILRSLRNERKNTGNDNRRSGTQGRDVNEGRKVFGHGMIESYTDLANNSRRYGLKGMVKSTKLIEWQLTPAAWMVKRENGLAPPYGGVLADQMGMGKTMVSLACIVGNPPTNASSDGFSGATLIIAPKEVVARQWQQEISAHVECIGPKEVYYYKRKIHAASGGDISRYKIVITTYQELVLSLPSDQVMRKLKKDCEEGEDFEKAFREVAGEVFSVRWYRVILDEAHEIKNTNTKVFNACNFLTTKNIWLLSATPLIDKADKETFSIVKTLRVENMKTKEDFKAAFPESSTQLDALMYVCTYRRTEKDEFLGEPILRNMMPFKTEVRWVELSKQERLAYDLMTEAYGKSEDKEISKKLKSIRTTRQRHFISHPYGIEKGLRTELAPELLEHMFNSLGVFSDGVAGDGVPMGQQLSLRSLIRYTHNEATMSFNKCGICGTGSIEEPQIIDTCNHVFCRDCLRDTWQFKAKEGVCQQKGCKTDYDKEVDVRMVMTLATKEAECDRLDETEAAADPSSSAQTLSSGRGLKRKKTVGKPSQVARERQMRAFINKKYGADFNGVLPKLADEGISFIKQGMRENEGKMPLGTKLTVAMNLIVQYQQERIRVWDKNDINQRRYEIQSPKTIVFHEFTKTAVALGIALNAKDITFVYLNGGLTETQKKKAIDAFQENKDIKVLIASFRIGGQALNLTCASKIIRIDSWWNESAEKQADGRVHRVGQMQVASSVDIKVKDTVDDRICELQAAKSEKIDHCLQDDGHSIQLFSELELIKLTAPQRYKELVELQLGVIREEDAAERIWVPS